ncbi:Rossmann-like domain-containing protein [Pectinatus haikarae]|uniref:Uncharacterized protein (DUF4213/DUF364 family) n=1 Tax=Pectinatus haikarae TaxID=349096 RepID=A0ABT9Y6X4_9FIRM|nr:DUF364 domain-containing protein [Pectinatus haikarae]MDQ0203571.1 uncharacterized protein (DUF4213/DUF364 family) [Pectinatus haikarae]
MWEIYDQLINAIPDGLAVEYVVAGTYHVCVRSELGMGLAPLLPGDMRSERYPREIGMPLKKLAEAVKSWNFIEASIGHAALNAYYNAIPVAGKNGIDFGNGRHSEDRLKDPFIAYQNAIKGKKVAVIGHFHYLDKLFAPVCDLSIIERTQQEGDYPLEAAEYILPQSDFVIIPCSSIAYKTLPRYLELAENAYVIMVGCSTTLSPVLFERGIDDLSGLVVSDEEKAKNIISGNIKGNIHLAAQKVSMKKTLFFKQ